MVNFSSLCYVLESRIPCTFRKSTRYSGKIRMPIQWNECEEAASQAVLDCEWIRVDMRGVENFDE